jgi:uncharacterized lipoprotein YmbA
MKFLLANKIARLATRGFCYPHLLLAACLLLSACSHEPAKFYLLNANSSNVPSTASPAINGQFLIGLGPIHVPDYLNRPQIVIAQSANQFSLDEQNRWAEPLAENISRSLGQFLAQRLGVEQLVRFPWPTRQVVDYQVSIDIFEFHQGPDQQSHLEAQWQLKHQEQVVQSQPFSCAIAASNQAAEIAQAQSGCLTRLGLVIESDIREQEKARQR